MYSVFLYFSDERQDAEEDVKKYPSDHGFGPKREFSERVDDTYFDVMCFGGCYIGNGHLQAIRKMQETVVEREMLAEEIRRVLSESVDDLSDATVDALVEKFHPQTTHEVAERGQIVVRVDSSAVKASFANRVAQPHL